MMERQVHRLTGLVDDLLDMSRLTQGKMQLHLERLDLARLVSRTAAERRPALEKGELTLTLAVPEIPVWVKGDRARLAQVLRSLLDNAVKFTDRGGKIAVELTVDALEQRALLAIRDTGVGVDPAILPRVFDAFAQADRSLDRPHGGLGLGLSLARGLVKLHGGAIQAKSGGPGQGAEFIICLPLEKEPPALSAQPGAPLAQVGPHFKVLVIEDSRDAAESLRILLELQGHEVHVTYSGPEGVKAALAWRPDVVVSDIGLPGMNGYGVAAALRNDPATAKTRLIALTGYGTEEDRRRSREVGFDSHLVKPVDPVVLQTVLVDPNVPARG
jgi:CheY-like chemotaxis protein